jgi:hypothetical protein
LRLSSASTFGQSCCTTTGVAGTGMANHGA